MDQIDYSLSDEDIRTFFKNKIKIVKYSEIKNMKHIDELLEPYQRCIILFEISGLNTGHWTLLQQCYDLKTDKPYILFMDSYGYIPENEISVIDKSFRKYSNQEHGFLFKLFDKQPQEIRYNQYHLQKLARGVNTCGKYCCVKGLYPFMSEDEFARLLNSAKMDRDKLISLIFIYFYKK